MESAIEKLKDGKLIYLTPKEKEWLIEQVEKVKRIEEETDQIILEKTDKINKLHEELEDQTKWADLYHKELLTYKKLSDERGKTILELKRKIETYKKSPKEFTRNYYIGV